MIAVELLLAVAAAASAPPAEQVDEDCVLVRREAPAFQPRRPRVLTQLRAASAPAAKKKRPVPTDDFDVICQDVRRLPPLIAIPPEVPLEFTPIPPLALETPELPPFAEPPPAVPCECFAGGGGGSITWWDFPAGGGLMVIREPAPASPIPEPPVWALLFIGVALVAGRRLS